MDMYKIPEQNNYSFCGTYACKGTYSLPKCMENYSERPESSKFYQSGDRMFKF